MGIATFKLDSGNTGVGITVQTFGHSNENAECQKCGAQRGNYQYCINCGHDSHADVGAGVDAASRVPAPRTKSPSATAGSAHNGSAPNGSAQNAAAYVDDSTQTVIDVFSSPEAKSLAEQLAALVAAQSKPQPPANVADVALAERPQTFGPGSAGAPPAAPGAAPAGVSDVAPAGLAPVTTPPPARANRPNLAVLMAAGLLAFALAGVAFARVLEDQPEDLRPKTGSLVSAQDTPAVASEDSPERVVCWDGSTAAALSDCGTPEGLRGIAWVFPSIQPEECEALGSVGRPQAWSCPVDADGPNEASIVYGELYSVNDGLNHYTRLYENGVGRQKVVGDRYVWRADRRNVRGIWQRSAMYVNQPWSVHIESGTKRGVKLAFNTVEFRSPDQLAGLGPAD